MIDLRNLTDECHGPEPLVFNEWYVVLHDEDQTHEETVRFKITRHNNRDAYVLVINHRIDYFDNNPEFKETIGVTISYHDWTAVGRLNDDEESLLYVRIGHYNGDIGAYELFFQYASSWRAEHRL